MSSRLRALGIGLIVCALVVTVVGSVSFSTTNIDRDFNAAVTDDANALVGYDSSDPIVAVNRGNHSNRTDSTPANINSEHTLVKVTNRLHTSIDVVDVEVDTSDRISVEIQQLPRNVGVGESAEIRAKISCVEPVGMADISVTVQIKGGHVAASIFGDTETRSISVTCA